MLQLLKAFLKVVVLIGLSEHNLGQGFLSLELNGCQKRFDVLNCLLLFCVFFVKEDLNFHEGKKTVFGADGENY